MKIIEPSVEFMTRIDGDEMLREIERVGRVCYKSEDRITADSARKFVAGIIKRGHEAVLEHASFKVKFTCDRGCYDEQTKVLTATRGWQYFKDLKDSDTYYTIDNSNRLKVVKAKELISYEVDEDLLHFQSTQVDLLVTKDHRMWLYDYDKRSEKTRIWKFIEAQQATNNRYKFYKSSQGTTNPVLQTFTIPAIRYRNSDNLLQDVTFPASEFFWLVGLWITDGCISQRKELSSNMGKLIISQSKPAIRNKLINNLNILNIPYRMTDTSFELNYPQLRAWLKEEFLQDNDYKKTYYLHLPRWIFTLGKENLTSLLEGIIDGDGTPITNSTGHQIYTASKAFGEDLLEIALLIGKTGNLRTQAPRERAFPNGYNCLTKEQYIISINDKTEHLFNIKSGATSLTEEHYKGKVYCVNLESDHRLFVMRNGKSVWCGNCSHELVRHRLASFCQESTRYCNYSKDKFGNELTVIKPCFWEEGSDNYTTWKTLCQVAESTYFTLLNTGATPQEARSVLPNSLKTEVVMSANLREWRHFFKLRCAAAAHPQMRQVAIMLLHMCKEQIPVVFDDIDENNL